LIFGVKRKKGFHHGLLGGFDSRWFSTSSLPVRYHAEAECPRWLEFLNVTLPVRHAGDCRIAVLQEYIGYCLLPGCLYHKALFLVGPGQSGKSTILYVVETLLGDENTCHFSLEQLAGTFGLDSMRGKLVNTSAEVDYMVRHRENLFKELVSGDPVTVNRKFKSPITLKPTAKLVFAANDLPAISDTTEGVPRRLIIIPCDHVVLARDVNPYLGNDLAREGSGILNWALEGLRRLRTQGQFSQCQVCDEALRLHKQTSNSVAEFFGECVQRDPGNDCISTHLYEIYAYWCRKSGRKAVHEAEFGKRVLRLRFRKFRPAATANGQRPYVYRACSLTAIGSNWMLRYSHDEDPLWTTPLHQRAHRSRQGSRPRRSEAAEG
jgi:putative DNA primase/helicase